MPTRDEHAEAVLKGVGEILRQRNRFEDLLKDVARGAEQAPDGGYVIEDCVMSRIRVALRPRGEVAR
jgi:hypothetical protein